MKRNKRLLSVGAVLIMISILLTGCFGEKEVSGLQINSESLGLKLEYPEGWIYTMEEEGELTIETEDEGTMITISKTEQIDVTLDEIIADVTEDISEEMSYEEELEVEPAETNTTTEEVTTEEIEEELGLDMKASYETEEMTIDGVKAVKVITSFEDGYSYEDIYCVKDNNLYMIYIYNSDETVAESNKEGINKIISSIKFI